MRRTSRRATEVFPIIMATQESSRRISASSRQGQSLYNLQACTAVGLNLILSKNPQNKTKNWNWKKLITCKKIPHSRPNVQGCTIQKSLIKAYCLYFLYWLEVICMSIYDTFLWNLGNLFTGNCSIPFQITLTYCKAFGMIKYVMLEFWEK